MKSCSISLGFPWKSMENHHTSWTVECNMGSRTAGCTLLLARCIVTAGSSIVCFVAFENLLPTAGACLGLTPEAFEHKCWVVAPRTCESLILAAAVLWGWIRATVGNGGWTLGVVERRVVCSAFLLLGRTYCLTLGIVWRTVWFLGTKCSCPPAVVAIVAEETLVTTAELVVATIVLLLT